MSSPRAEFLDLYRAGVNSAVDLMKTSLESQVKTLDEPIALQASMARDQFERAVGYWSELCRAAGENQTAAIGQMQEQAAKARDWISQGATQERQIRQSGRERGATARHLMCRPDHENRRHCRSPGEP